MSLILSIDTATPAGSVALHNDGELIGLHQYHIEKSHSTLLHVTIEQLLENCSIDKSDISAIAVSGGPGSYTGLRIGVSSAKGLCFGLDVPLIAVNTLEAMARQISNTMVSEALLCPMIDARRQEVYCLIADRRASVLKETEAVVVDENSFENELSQGQVIFFGDGAEKCKSILTHSNALFIDSIIPSAKEIGELAYEKFEQESFENLAYYEPFYLKEFRILESKKKYF